MNTALHMDAVRAAFPGLETDWILLDNAGGSQIARHAVERIQEYYYGSNVQHGAAYGLSEQAAERVAAGRQATAAMLNVAPEEVLFGPSTTQLLANLAAAMEERFAPGDEIIVSTSDHESNIGPWERLKRRGVHIRPWRVHRDSWLLEAAELPALINERTRLLCITQTSNILGAINPVAEIVQVAHRHNIEVCIDGVAYTPHRAADLRSLGADYYVYSCYKVFGPHLAVLHGRRAKLEALANINHYFLDGQLPYKLQPGGLNYELTCAQLGVAEYLAELAGHCGSTARGFARYAAAFAAITRHEEALGALLLDYLKERGDVRIIGPENAAAHLRVPTISFVLPGRHSGEIAAALAGCRIGARAGHFYAYRFIEELGLAQQGGVVRVSMAHYNTVQEIQALLRALDEIL